MIQDKPLKISVIILTLNEERHIARCIRNLQMLSEEIFVVDSFSTDRTCETAKSLGVHVVQHKFVNQAQQFQWALDTLHCSGDWVMRMDADEYLSDKLISEIRETLPALPADVTGCNFLLDVVFLQRKLRYGRLHPPSILRLWRRGAAYMEQRWMDERCVLKSGRAITLKHHFIDHNLNGLTWWTQKHNIYASRELAVEIGRQYGLSFDSASDMQSSRNRKKSSYYRLPLFLRALAYFSIRYILLGGFLDGRPGLIWATLQAFWYRFLIDAKIYELKKHLGENPSRDELLAYFQTELGIKINHSTINKG